MLALFEGSEGALRALTTAMHIARAEGRDLVVLVAVPDAAGEKAASALEHRAAERLRAAGVSPRYQRLTGANAASLIEAVRHTRADLLVVSEDTTALGSEGLHALLAAIGCLMVVAR